MTQRPDWTALARRTPVLQALPSDARRLAVMRHVAAGETVFRRGDRPVFIYFVARGEVRLIRLSRNGDPVVLQRARNGFLAEASLHQSAYHCDAVSTAKSELLAIPKRTVAAALDHTSFRDEWLKLMAGELRRVRTQNERLGLRSAQLRIFHYIETEGDGRMIDLAQTKKDWAQELGLTHEALYRALAAMKRSRMLRIEGSRLTLAEMSER